MTRLHPSAHKALSRPSPPSSSSPRFYPSPKGIFLSKSTNRLRDDSSPSTAAQNLHLVRKFSHLHYLAGRIPFRTRSYLPVVSRLLAEAGHSAGPPQGRACPCSLAPFQITKLTFIRWFHHWLPATQVTKYRQRLNAPLHYNNRNHNLPDGECQPE